MMPEQKREIDNLLELTGPPPLGRGNRAEDRDALRENLRLAVAELDSLQATRAAMRSQLLHLAAVVLKGDWFLSPDPDDNSKSTPRSVLRIAEKQREILINWGHEIGQIARR